MSSESFIRVTEFLYALRVFVLAGKKLTQEDMTALEEIVKLIRLSNGLDGKLKPESGCPRGRKKVQGN